jgi:hypothetical protein
MKIPTQPKFTAKDHFTLDSKTVEISYIGSNFKSNFLAKRENPELGFELKIETLGENKIDSEILENFTNLEVSLSTLWYLLTLQPKGESGALLTNGYANIFYIRDVKNTLSAVLCNWDSDDGWSVEASPVADPYGWAADDQVFSRDSETSDLSTSETLSPSEPLAFPLDEIVLNGMTYIAKSAVERDSQDLRLTEELKAIRAEHLGVANKITAWLKKHK